MIHTPISRPLNAFSVDVEDYYHVTAFEKRICRTDWDRYESRVVDNTRRILQLLGRHDVKATFFVLGWVARRYPELVKEIHGAGHEIGSHGLEHRLIYQLTPEEFRRDIRESRDTLAEIIDEPVTAFRAPSFSITKQSLWALDILVEEGFTIDTSIFPTRHPRYGIPGFEPKIQQIDTSAGPLREFPMTVARLAKMNVPVSGGGYFRLYPLAWTLHMLRQVNRTGAPFVFYIHPWEIDPEQPRLQVCSRVSRFRHYVNLSKTEARLDILLQQFRFGRLSEVVDQAFPSSNGRDASRESQSLVDQQKIS